MATLIIALATWCAHAEAMLAQAQRIRTGGDTSALRTAVEEGRGALFAVFEQGASEPLGYCVLKDDGDALKVAAAAGACPGVDLIRELNPWIEDMARRAFRRVHVETARPGLVRKLQRLGYVVGDIIGPRHVRMVKELPA
jgi:hypothetical protein